jgi:enoyl-CoA hydratase/carnithine racemase
MASDVVLYEVQDGVAVITLNRPERLNAWTGELGAAYYDRLDEAVADGNVGAIVVTGAGRGFCAGADMDLLQGIGGGGGAGEANGRPMHHPYKVPKLTVAALNGATAGLGLVQALYLDVRFAAAGAKFTVAFPQRGLIGEYGISWLLPRLIGTGAALDVLLSSRVLRAEEAASLGIVNRVVAPEDLLSESIGYARTVAANCSPASIAALKTQVHADTTATLDEALARAGDLMQVSLKGPDFTEGVQSYVQKRPAAFAPLGKGTDFGDLLES